MTGNLEFVSLSVYPAGMPVEDLSSALALVHRDGRFFRARGSGLEELKPVNGALKLADGFVLFAGDPFPPGGQGTYRIGEADQDGAVKLYPGLVLDAHADRPNVTSRRLRIGYRYLGEYRQ